MLLNQNAEVVGFLQEAAATKLCAFDIEFASSERYVPDLGLLQLAWRAPDGSLRAVAVDPLSSVDLSPVWNLLQDPAIKKVVHAPKQDLGLLQARYSVSPQNLWDCQLAAEFLGLGEQMGLARLAEAMLGQTVSKAEQFSDWLKRPLSAKQLAYALADAELIHAIWQQLEPRLLAQEKLSWLAEESDAMVASMRTRRPADQAYKSVAGWQTLSPKALSVLIQLAALREEWALAENKPPRRFLADATLIRLAKEHPSSLDRLARIREIPRPVTDRYGEAIVERIVLGSKLEPPEKALRNRPLGPADQQQSVVLTALVNFVAGKEQVVPTLLASRSDLEEFVRWQKDRASADPSILQGWRKNVLGALALDWMDGKLALKNTANGPEFFRM